MVVPDHSRLSIVRQCGILGVSRSTFYYEAVGENPLNIRLMDLMDKQYLDTPYYGVRRMRHMLSEHGFFVSRKRVRRLMRLMGLVAIYQKPNTSRPHPEHRIYPYLLRNVAIERSNHVWCSDITYIPMRRGFLYLVAIMDWASRRVLSRRLSNTLDTRFCVEALEEALRKHGKPEIFNTDQGCQFTSEDFTGVLKAHGVQISMDGKGRWMDNVMVERLWRSLKYECVFLHSFENGMEAEKKIGEWIDRYNHLRPHFSLDYLTPDKVYFNNLGAGPPAPMTRLKAA